MTTQYKFGKLEEQITAQVARPRSLTLIWPASHQTRKASCAGGRLSHSSAVGWGAAATLAALGCGTATPAQTQLLLLILWVTSFTSLLVPLSPLFPSVHPSKLFYCSFHIADALNRLSLLMLYILWSAMQTVSPVPRLNYRPKNRQWDTAYICTLNVKGRVQNYMQQ